MGVLRVFLNKKREVLNCRGMVLDHLVGLRPLVDVPDITRVPLDTLKILNFLDKKKCVSLPLSTEKSIFQTSLGCSRPARYGRRCRPHRSGRARW